MKKVIGCSQRFYSYTSHSTRPLDARSQSSSLSSASSWSASLPTGVLFELLFRQHRIQCNSVQHSTSEHAFISMETRKEENNNTMAEIKTKGKTATAAHIYKDWPTLIWPVLVCSSSCEILDRQLIQHVLKQRRKRRN